MKHLKLFSLAAVLSAIISAPVFSQTITAKANIDLSSNALLLYCQQDAMVQIKWDAGDTQIGFGGGIRNFVEVMNFNTTNLFPDPSFDWIDNPFICLTFNAGNFYLGVGIDPTLPLKPGIEYDPNDPESGFLGGLPFNLCGFLGYDIPLTQQDWGNLSLNLDLSYFVTTISAGDNGIGSAFTTLFGVLFPKAGIGLTYTFDWDL